MFVISLPKNRKGHTRYTGWTSQSCKRVKLIISNASRAVKCSHLFAEHQLVCLHLASSTRPGLDLSRQVRSNYCFEERNPSNIYVPFSCTLSRRDKAPANSSPNRSAVSFPSILRTWNFAQMITIRFGLITRLALSVSSLHWVPTSLVWPMMFCTSVIKDWTWGQTHEIKKKQVAYSLSPNGCKIGASPAANYLSIPFRILLLRCSKRLLNQLVHLVLPYYVPSPWCWGGHWHVISHQLQHLLLAHTFRNSP